MQSVQLTSWSSITIGVDTPNGKMYVTLMDDDEGCLSEVLIHAGKAGGAVHAWASSLSRIMTTALERGAGVNDLIRDMSLQTTSERTRNTVGDVTIRSGPDGVCFALMEYRRAKYRELREKLGGNDDDDGDTGYRAARMGR